MHEPLGPGLVIGASSGIGLAVFRRLAGQVRLTAAARTPMVVERVGATWSPCDVRDPASVARCVTQAAGGGKLDFIVSAAGVGYYAPLTGDYAPQWREILETNVLGLLNLLAVVHRQQPELRILVQIGSLAAHRVSRTPGNLVYSVSKAAARTILSEYRSQIRGEGRTTKIALVSPGFVRDTRFGDRFFSHQPAAARDLYAGVSALTPDQVATAVVDLLHAEDEVEVTEVVLRPRGQAD